MSARKRRLIEASRSDAEQQLLNLAEQLHGLSDPVAVPLGWLREWVEGDAKGPVYETPQQMASIMRRAGMIITTDRVKISGGKQFLVLNKAEAADWPAAKLRAIAKRPTELQMDEY